MASTRAQEIAEILWELKRADKIAPFSTIAERAGFSAGSNGRSVLTALRSVRKDWPHLQWWRAVSDTFVLEKDGEQAEMLAEAGYELEVCDDGEVTLKSVEEHLMEWSKETVD